MEKEGLMDEGSTRSATSESARAELIEMTNGTFAPWLERLNARRTSKPAIDIGVAVDVWVIVSRLVTEHCDRGRHLNRKEVGELLGQPSATNRRRLEVCDQLGLLEIYIRDQPPGGAKMDQRSSFTRPTKEAVRLIDAQCREWAVGFGKLQPKLVEYYGLPDLS